jgi:hypothetical protein
MLTAGAACPKRILAFVIPFIIAFLVLAFEFHSILEYSIVYKTFRDDYPLPPLAVFAASTLTPAGP